jgi:hypothetical protein
LRFVCCFFLVDGSCWCWLFVLWRRGSGRGVCGKYFMLMMWHLWCCVKMVLLILDTGTDVAMWPESDGRDIFHWVGIGQLLLNSKHRLYVAQLWIAAMRFFSVFTCDVCCAVIVFCLLLLLVEERFLVLINCMWCWGVCGKHMMLVLTVESAVLVVTVVLIENAGRYTSNGGHFF